MGRKPTRAKPDFGLRLAARRAELGRKSAAAIEQQTGQRIYSKLLWRLETGRKDPLDLTLVEFHQLLAALEWTPREFAEGTRTYLPLSLLGPDPLGPGAGGAEVVTITVSPMARLPGVAQPRELTVLRRALSARRPEDLFALTIPAPAVEAFPSRRTGLFCRDDPERKGQVVAYIHGGRVNVGYAVERGARAVKTDVMVDPSSRVFVPEQVLGSLLDMALWDDGCAWDAPPGVL